MWEERALCFESNVYLVSFQTGRELVFCPGEEMEQIEDLSYVEVQISCFQTLSYTDQQRNLSVYVHWPSGLGKLHHNLTISYCQS